MTKREKIMLEQLERENAELKRTASVHDEMFLSGQLAKLRAENAELTRRLKVSEEICADCTTPAILCPNANEPKGSVRNCAMKNYQRPLPQVEKEPAPIREKELCFDCDNQQDCEDYMHGRQQACTDKFVPRKKAMAPAPLRNENELCRECANRHSCDDYKNGRKKACSDFGFVKEQDPAPAPKVIAAKINPITFPCPVCGTACWRSCSINQKGE